MRLTMRKPRLPCIGSANWRNRRRVVNGHSERSEQPLSRNFDYTYLFRCDMRSVRQAPHYVQGDTLDLGE